MFAHMSAKSVANGIANSICSGTILKTIFAGTVLVNFEQNTQNNIMQQ